MLKKESSYILPIFVNRRFEEKLKPVNMGRDRVTNKIIVGYKAIRPDIQFFDKPPLSSMPCGSCPVIFIIII